MRRFLSKNLAVFLALILLVCMFPAEPAKAADEAGVYFSEIYYGDVDVAPTLKKDLVIREGFHIPDATFGFTIDKGSAKLGGSDELDVLAGVDADKIVISHVEADVNNAPPGQIVYQDAPEPANSDPTADYVTKITNLADTEHYIAEKTTKLDFSRVNFKKPGVYRYILTESGENTGISNDPEPTRTIDVYIGNRMAKNGDDEYQCFTYTNGAERVYCCNVDGKYYKLNAQGTITRNAQDEINEEEVTTDATAATDLLPQLQFLGTLMYLGTVTECPTTEDIPDGAVKSEGFRNVYDEVSLTIEKKLKGNTADKSEYFIFTLEISGAEVNKQYNVDRTNMQAFEGFNPETITVGTDGTATVQFKLQGGQSATINGITKGTSYRVSENADLMKEEGYSVQITSVGDDTNKKVEAEFRIEDMKTGSTVTDKGGLTESTVLTFTNTRTSVLATGVILKVLPVVITGVVVLAVVIILIVVGKKRRNDDEETEDEDEDEDE